MCTSFVVHGDQTIIGMNLDISDRPIKFVLKGNDQLIIMQSENGKFYPAFGCNRNGTFMNLLMVDSHEDGVYKRGKNCVHIMRLFDEILSSKINISSLGDYLHTNKIVNVPDYSVHSMIAGKEHITHIVEPGREPINMDSIDTSFMVLTNFALSEQLEKSYKQVTGPGHDRYVKAYEMISSYIQSFNMEHAFQILRETAQQSGEYPTQLSLISIPEEHKVFFVLPSDYTRVFEYCFESGEMRLYTQNASDKKIILTKNGISLMELASW